MTEVENIMSDREIEELGNSMKVELRNGISSDTVYDSGTEFCLIPRIHEHIRVIDRNSYEPMMLSIGPYHNGSPALSSMERDKWNRLDTVLKLNCEKGLKDYLTVINKLEKRARMCYSGDVKMNKRKLLQTLLLDGCFILISLGEFNEFIKAGVQRGTCSPSRVKTLEEVSTSGHPIVTVENEIQEINTRNQSAMKSNEVDAKYQDNTQQNGLWYDAFVTNDLLLLENQIPFFIVEGIYEVLISNKMVPTSRCTSSVARYMEEIVPFYPMALRESNLPEDYDHLLHLCHMYFRPSSKQVEHHDHIAQHYIHHFLGQDYLSSQDGHFPNRWRRATQYHEAGIEFRRRTYSEQNPHSLLDIMLRDGVLEIPLLFVDDKTNLLFRNFIALEQTCPQVGNDVTAYIVFMAQLMSMPDDVALLARKGAIAHHMRTDRDVSQLFTRLTKGVVFDFYGNYYLKNLCLALEAHYQNRLRRWIAWLRHNQFGNPWLAVAGLAAVIVLFCTVAQTVLTVLSYVDPK